MKAQRVGALVGVWLCMLVLAGCGDGSAQVITPPASAALLKVSSAAFQANGKIPARYACGGEELSPPLTWEGVPTGTRSLALIMDDPDAPVGDYVHWIVYNLPADAAGLPEGASSAGGASQLLKGTQQGKNSANQSHYASPCPPSGQHRYFFRLYALDQTLELQSPNKAALNAAMDGHILGQGELVGVYQK